MAEIAGLHYEVHGAKDAPPVVLSPGLGGSSAYWAPNLTALAERHRVILYDHRGTGRSDRALAPDVTVAAMADDVLALLDGLGIARASLIGHAAGGLIGLDLAHREPGRIDRLVVINGWSRADPHFLRCMETRLALLHNSGVEAFVRAQPLFLYPARWISAHWTQLMAEEPGHIAHFQGAANVEARIAALAAFDLDTALASIATPTLVIVAEDDILVPASCSDRIAAGLPDARLGSMEGGHACNVTEPEAFNRLVLDFLGS